MRRAIQFFLILLFPFLTAIGQQGKKNTPDDMPGIFIDRPEVYFEFDLKDKGQIHELTRVISIDRLDGLHVHAYANYQEFTNFLAFGLDCRILPPPAMEFPEPALDLDAGMQAYDWDFYPSYSAYEALMYQFETSHPGLCEIINAGTLASGRKILLAHISNTLDSASNKPQFLYVSSIHGDELTGCILMLRLIDYLLTNYGAIPRITDIVDKIDIFINPMMNPDGTYYGGNASVNGAKRYNAAGVDLNRNFPDPDGGLHPDGNPWQEETVIMMNFAQDHHFVLSANFHGGEEVINYPWDTRATLTADDNWWQLVGRTYVDTVHLYSPANYFNGFNNGITNGYAWYEIEGGRQDYMNYWQHCREVTVEISDIKKPAASSLPNYWDYNYRSLLNYMETCLYGIRGIVTDSMTGQPLHARVYIPGHDLDSSEVYSHLPVGNYHRLLYPGNYNLTFSAPGYYPKTVNGLNVSPYTATIQDVQLVPLSIGLNACNEAHSLEVYPNPSCGFINWSWQTTGNSNIRLDLFDVTGRVVVSQKMKDLSHSTQSLDLTNLRRGVYLLQLQDSWHSAKTRLILQ